MDNFDIHKWRRNQLLESVDERIFKPSPSQISFKESWEKFKKWLFKQEEKLKRVIQRTSEVYNFEKYGGFYEALKEFFVAAAEEFGPIGLAALIGGPTAASMMTVFKVYSWINKLGNGKIIKVLPPIKCPNCGEEEGIWPGSYRCSKCRQNYRMNEEKTLTEEEAKIQNKLTSPEEFKDKFSTAMQPEVDKFKPFNDAVVELTKKYPKVGLALQYAMVKNVVNKLPSSNEEFKSRLIDALTKSIQDKKVEDDLVNSVKNAITQL